MSEVVCEDLNLAIDDLRGKGFRVDLIYPADDPHTVVLSRGGESARLTTRPGAPAPSPHPPSFEPEFVLTRGGASGLGRAGMNYRDLIPGRLGGSYIASHITIPDGGPVADWVHYHRIRFQMICVRKGWVRLVYEDQGEPFVMKAGDLVLQPPEIRHRVLESSAGLEVVEIGCPSLHATIADHVMELPNSRLDPDRDFRGQRFLRHVASETPWTPFAGGEAQETAMSAATKGFAEVRTIRSAGSDIDFPRHDGELVFGFVLEGSGRLNFRGGHEIGSSSAFAIPPDEEWSLSAMSDDFRLLHVTTCKLSED